METDNKHFLEWIELKSDLHFTGNYPLVKEGQVWWCAVGENVGVEINGKHDTFFAASSRDEKIKPLWFHGCSSCLTKTRGKLVY